MIKKINLTLLLIILTLSAYVIIRADAWRLLIFSEKTSGKIVQVQRINQDPHTTTSKVGIKYSFTASDGKTYHGSGYRVLENDESIESLSRLQNSSVSIVYVTARPDLNEISGHEKKVLFPLILIPFILVIASFNARQSRKNIKENRTV